MWKPVTGLQSALTVRPVARLQGHDCFVDLAFLFGWIEEILVDLIFVQNVVREWRLLDRLTGVLVESRFRIEALKVA